MGKNVESEVEKLGGLMDFDATGGSQEVVNPPATMPIDPLRSGTKPPNGVLPSPGHSPDPQVDNPLFTTKGQFFETEKAEFHQLKWGLPEKHFVKLMNGVQDQWMVVALSF